MNQENPDLPAASVLAGRYELGRRLREEPWGEVWLARDRLLGVEIGLKLLPPDAAQWAAAQGYFEQEAVLALRLRHPKILAVFHLEPSAEGLFLVQEPFDGESLLAQLARQQRFSLPQSLRLLEQISQALAFAHQRGGVHHGLNPLNILLKGEEVRVANFAFPREDGSQVLTLELKAYDAPEVIYGDTPTTASNVFSLGVLGFRLVAGSLPYALTFDEPFPYRLETLPADLGEIPLPLQNLLLRCLSADPEERFPDMAAFLEQLRQVRELKSRGREPDYQGWESEKAAGLKPAARVGALLGRAWQVSRPLAQKGKDATLRTSKALLSSPRRLLWGLGLAGLVALVVLVGIKLNQRPPEVAPVTAPSPAKVPAPVVGPPPMTETEPPAASREQPPATRLAPGPAPSSAPAAAPVPAPEGAKAKEEHYVLVAGSYANQKQAQALQQKLKKDNFKARIVSRSSGGKTQYQVQVGPVVGLKAAEDLAQSLKAKEKITPRIMKMAAKTKPTKPATATPARRTAR